MSKTQLLAFEKNNYYYGKLLTVRDFQLEQQYGISKHRLINRLVIGSGVVSGLQVDKTGGRGIRISPGVAIDGNGAEIVVSREYVQSDIKELSGYPLEGEGDKTVYVTLGFEECSREPIPTLANSSSCQEVCEANRIVETFKVELTPDPPAEETGLCRLLHESTLLYQNETFKLERIIPRFVTPGDAFEVIVRLTALQSTATIDYIEFVLIEAIPDTLSRLKTELLQFVPGGAPAGSRWEKKYTLRAGGQTGAGIIGGTLSIYANGSNENLDAPGSSVGIIEDEAIQQKLTELAFSREEAGENDEDGGVIIAAITVDGEGLITKIDDTRRRYVYNNQLLSKLMACGDSRMGKLPAHALSHGFEGSDPINVTNLQGILAEPQKVIVYTEGDSYVEARRFSFSGTGVTVTQPWDDHVNVSIAGGVSGSGPHAATHQAGGSDPLDVSGLPGLLQDTQKVSIHGKRADGSSINVAAKSVFFNGGTIADHDGSAHINLPNYDVITGTVLFKDLAENVIYVSNTIEVDARGKAISFVFETDEWIRTQTLSNFEAWAAFQPGTQSLLIYSRHKQAGARLTWRVRYFLIPTTTDKGEVGSHTIMN